MKSILNILFTPVFLLASSFEQNQVQSDLAPQETLVVQSSEWSHDKWSLQSRSLSSFEGFSQWVKPEEKNSKMSHQFAMRFVDKKQLEAISPLDVHKVCYYFLIPRFEGVSPQQLFWQVIDSGKDHITLEWILKAPIGSIPPQHVVTKAYLTGAGLHLISLTRNNELLKEATKESFLKTLKEGTFVKSFEGALGDTKALSQAKKTPPRFVLGQAFEGWKLSNLQEMEDVLVECQYLRDSFSSMTGPQEVLKLKQGSCSTFKIGSAQELFSETVGMFEQQFRHKLYISEIASSENEKTFSFSVPQQQGYINFIIRLGADSTRWFDFSVMTMSDRPLSSSDAAFWYEKLSKISAI